MNPFEQLARSDRSVLVAPAGYGKTETIVRAVQISEGGRQLILTHTHAGVESIRRRLRKLCVPHDKYQVYTIAQWARKFTIAYPLRAGYTVQLLGEEEFNRIYEGFNTLLDLKFVKNLITNLYSGVYVDEYQDCSQRQHQIVLKLADLIPCRLLGDPLQAIFDFDTTDPAVIWDEHVRPNFNELPPLTTPYRWKGKNEQLANVLQTIRIRLLEGKPIDLTQLRKIGYCRSYEEKKISGAISAVSSKRHTECVIVRSDHKERKHSIAQNLRGFASIEEMEAKALMGSCKKFDTLSGSELACEVIEFASKCNTGIKKQLRTIYNKLQKADLDFSRISAYPKIAEILSEIAETSNKKTIFQALATIKRDISGKHTKLYRRDLWDSMLDALSVYDSEVDESLADCAQRTRDRTRIIGRRQYNHIVGTTLLLKGLEFDNCIVLDVESMTVENFYVAITRGAHKLTILSNADSLQFESKSLTRP